MLLTIEQRCYIALGWYSLSRRRRRRRRRPSHFQLSIIVSHGETFIAVVMLPCVQPSLSLEPHSAIHVETTTSPLAITQTDPFACQ